MDCHAFLESLRVSKRGRGMAADVTVLWLVCGAERGSVPPGPAGESEPNRILEHCVPAPRVQTCQHAAVLLESVQESAGPRRRLDDVAF